MGARSRLTFVNGDTLEVSENVSEVLGKLIGVTSEHTYANMRDSQDRFTMIRMTEIRTITSLDGTEPEMDGTTLVIQPSD